jgi:hypothetical protein
VNLSLSLYYKWNDGGVEDPEDEDPRSDRGKASSPSDPFFSVLK